MRFRVERPRRRGVSQGRNRFRVAALAGESDPQVQRRIRVIGVNLEHDTKRPLGLCKLLLLQMLPSFREARVGRRRIPSPLGAASGTCAPRKDDSEPCEIHGAECECESG